MKGLDREKLATLTPERVRKLLHMGSVATTEAKIRLTKVPNESSKGKPAVPNEISDDTGQYDMRFLLWRMFCKENGLPVATMPGDLEGDLRDKWEQLKEDRLKKKRK